MLNQYLKREIQIPKSLWKLHGTTASVSDLAFTYLFALTVTAITVYGSRELPAWKMLLIAALSLDIAGGAISNFTTGTIAYYQQSTLSPHKFIWLHALQTAALTLVYPGSFEQILSIGTMILIFSSATVTLWTANNQKPVGVFLLGVILLTQTQLKITPAAAEILLALLALKLITGYASHWKKI